MRLFTVLSFVSLLLFASCKSENTKNSENNSSDSVLSDTLFVKNKEIREDSLLIEEAYRLRTEFSFKITADIETEVMNSEVFEDAADDIAIWLNEYKPSGSIILGTNKKEGIYVFDLNGKILDKKVDGFINNIDLRDGFMYKGKEVVLVAGSNYQKNCISLYYIDKETSDLSDLIAEIPLSVNSVYGLSMYLDEDNGTYYVIINDRDAVFQQWLVEASNDSISFQMVKTYSVSSQSEGIAVNEKTNIVYFAVEQEGIFKISADPTIKDKPVRIKDSGNENPNIKYDIEGMDVFRLFEKDYLIASIQGNFSYAIFELGDIEKYIGSFVIIDGNIDGVEETDGLDILTTNLFAKFPGGLIVVQDGFNYDGETLKSQNFKYISLHKIINLIK